LPRAASSERPTSSNLSATRTFIGSGGRPLPERLPVKDGDGEAVERLVARLGDDHVADLDLRVRVDPLGHLLAEPLALRHHGRREHLDPVEAAVLAEGCLADADVRTHDATATSPC